MIWSRMLKSKIIFYLQSQVVPFQTPRVLSASATDNIVQFPALMIISWPF